jgi:hypothetical protein
MTIYQPRRENIDTWEIDKEPLYQWAEETLKPLADLAYKGEGEFCSGEWCRFCRAASKCRARADTQLDLARQDFNLPPLLPDDEVAAILPRLDGLIDWAETLKKYALEAAVHHGKAWPGYKVVAGRSIRKYGDVEEITKTLLDNNYDLDTITNRELLSITDMERILGKKKFGDILGALITKPPGKPTLVPNDDKRQPITTITEFEENEE